MARAIHERELSKSLWIIQVSTLANIIYSLPNVGNSILFQRAEIDCIQRAISPRLELHNIKNLYSNTGKSLSEALIFVSTNPQYDNRLFIVHENHKLRIPAEHVVYTNCCFWFCFDIQNNFGTQYVLQMLQPSGKDLPVFGKCFPNWLL